MIKDSIKRVLPSQLTNLIANILVAYREHRLNKMSTAEAFDEVYRRNMWKQGSSLSGPGSSGVWAKEYQRLVAEFISEKGIGSILDIGCGDFSVGAFFAPLVEKIVAVDISKYIIDENKTKYASIKNVIFLDGDICEFQLPKAELVLVRQVLQHLPNAQIEKALRNIESSGARYAIIAEHIIKPEVMTQPNIDLPSHSVRTRVGAKSGVLVTSPPFSRSAKLLEIIEPDAATLAEPESVLAIFLLEFY